MVLIFEGGKECGGGRECAKCYFEANLCCVCIQHESERSPEALRKECRPSHQGSTFLLPATAACPQAHEERRDLARRHKTR